MEQTHRPESEWHRPGHIADQEGNRYLYVDKGEVIRLTDDGLATIGQKQKVYEGWRYPNHWETECMCLESPKLNYHNGYYYLTSAQGGTAGPATSHMAVAARSRVSPDRGKILPIIR